MISLKKKSLKRIGIGIIIALVIHLAVSAVVTKTVYDHAFRRYDTVAEIPEALAPMAAERELLTFGEDLCGYLYRREGKGLVVVVPGFHAGADDYLRQIHGFLTYGWDVFAFDPTGCCRSGGDSAVGFSRIIEDVEQALRFVEEQDRFGCEALFLFGHSRGGYGVCGAVNGTVDAVVTVSGVNSGMEAIMQPVADRIGLLAYGNYPLLQLYQHLLFGADAATDAAEELQTAGVPALVVQGTEDELYPPHRYSVYAHGRQAEHIEYYLCEAGHTDLLEDDALMAKINRFFEANKGEI